MDVKTIAKLADIMSQHMLTGLEVHEGDTSIRLSRESCIIQKTAEQLPVETAEATVVKETPPDNTAMVSAPMPGTFYTSGAPELPPFVKEGDHVGIGTVVCIVEAMKVMNEVKSEVSGVVSKVLVENGSPVEYGQPLFEIRID
ncbi:MAG: acetyl-CoA carboxylase biotin carboxyl carrier protein [Lentisphaerae bacterium]|jgi:acetyl-CoA carboxylase biotin carboxyl carrier protein|nr:acetyl-CoA carboxylase biotin carboxyl carrier protein [Lentisphaerota bacterium]